VYCKEVLDLDSPPDVLEMDGMKWDPTTSLPSTPPDSPVDKGTDEDSRVRLLLLICHSGTATALARAFAMQITMRCGQRGWEVRAYTA
jgi:hypothetical protein